MLRVSAGLVYGYMHFYDLYQGTKQLGKESKEEALRTNDFELRLHLTTLLAGVDLPSGLGLGLVLPAGRAESTRYSDTEATAGYDAFGNPLENTVDTGLGDMEVRIRQVVNRFFPGGSRYVPRVVLSLGAGAPTGEYVVNPGLVTADVQKSSDRYISLGRGVWWALVDMEVYGVMAERLGYYLSLNGRVPITDIVEYEGTASQYEFTWGNELRGNLGLNGVLMPGLLNASIAAEWQWRGLSVENGEDFLNGGGHWVSVNPMLQVVLPAGLSATATVRLPVWRDVVGLQVAPSTGIFFSLNWAWRDTPPAPKPSVAVGEVPAMEEIASLLEPGKITLVDYWATWCEPCKKLGPIVEAFAESRPDVVLKKVDATEWGAPEMKRLLPAVPGLPVLDIYGPDRKLIKRLSGSPCFGFASDVPAPVDAPASASPTTD